jgi:hypothetical protein
MAGARADFHVVGLQQGAAAFGPVILEFENDFLESQHCFVERIFERG